MKGKTTKAIQMKNSFMTFAFGTLLAFSYTLLKPLSASAAFGKISVDGKGVSEVNTTDGIYSDMNTLLTVILSVAGFVVVAALIFAGVKIATAQGNPQARTQGFVGLAVAFIGGWIVYKCLTVAGWIKGFGGESGFIFQDPMNLLDLIKPFL